MAKIAKIWLEPIQGYDPWKNSEEFCFDQKTAERMCKIFPRRFKHKKGEFAGQPFNLEPWEKKIVGHLFGWKRKDGTRRYRRALVYVPKKNGKTQLMAGVGLICLAFDDEPGAEVYIASGDQDQANIMFEAATHSVENDEELSENIKVQKSYHLMTFEATGSYWKVLSSNAKTKHGPNISALFLDELHVFPDEKGKQLIETLEAGIISRLQPLIVYTTTADYSRPSPCNEVYEYAKKIRDGIVPDPYFLPVIYEADEEKDDWTKEETWKKANPNYGISVKRDYFVEEVQRAKENPSKENAFKRLHLNIQTKKEKKWMEMQDWDLSGHKMEVSELAGKRCLGALDLASTTDIAAFGLYFPEQIAYLLWCWVPEKTAAKRIQYEIWAKDGYIEIAKGITIDHDVIREKIKELKKIYDFSKIAYDPWNAAQIAKNLGEDDGFEMVEFRQGYKSMNEPTKALEKLILNHALIHFGNPVLRWMISNTDAVSDRAGNVKLMKPDKDSPLKIDGVITLVMGHGLSIAEEPEEKSAFDSKDFDKTLQEIYKK